MTATVPPDAEGASGPSRRLVLTVPLLAGVGALTSCTGSSRAGSSTSPSASVSTSPPMDLQLENTLMFEVTLLDWATSLRLIESQQVLGAHVDALRAAGATGALDGAPAAARTKAGFVRALDAAADRTQQSAVRAGSGSTASLLASIAASDAALAASLRPALGTGRG
ncbi:MAG: hypothetical protein WAN48_14940 [Actinomycetes bacterium]